MERKVTKLVTKAVEIIPRPDEFAIKKSAETGRKKVGQVRIRPVRFIPFLTSFFSFPHEIEQDLTQSPVVAKRVARWGGARSIINLFLLRANEGA